METLLNRVIIANSKRKRKRKRKRI